MVEFYEQWKVSVEIILPSGNWMRVKMCKVEIGLDKLNI